MGNKQIKVVLYRESIYGLSSNALLFMKEIGEYLSEVPFQYKNEAVIRFEKVWERYENEPSFVMEISYYRDETPQEEESRKFKEQEEERIREEKDKLLLKALKEKYE